MAAVGTALTAVPLLPPPLSFIGPLLTALGTALLGVFAADRAAPPEK